MNHGDLREWATQDLYDKLMKIVNAKSKMREPYGILVHLQDKYAGRRFKKTSNHLLHGEKNGESGEKELDLRGKKVIHNSITILPEHKIPKIKILGTCCFKVYNKIGKVDCLWVCPHDRPGIENFEVAGTNEVLAKSADGMPIVYS